MANPNLNSDSTRSSWRPFVVCVAIVSLGAFIAVFSIREYKSVFRSFETFSAVWLTHDMLVAHMNHTNGDWPSDWDDLEPYFKSINPGYGLPDLAWVRDRVHIDFNFDPTALDSSTATQDNTIWRCGWWTAAKMARFGMQMNESDHLLSIDSRNRPRLKRRDVTMQCTGAGEHPVLTWTITRASPVIASVL
jgi:hypothetical protein